METYIGQIHVIPPNSYGITEGYIHKNENLIPLMNRHYNQQFIIFKIAIFSKENHEVIITNSDNSETTFQIGKTGILELHNVDIRNITFKQDEDYDTFIEYMAY